MIKRIKAKLAKMIVQKLLLSVTEDEILSVKGGKLYRGENLVPREDVEALISGARSLEHSLIWKAITKDTKYLLNKKIAEGADTTDDLIFARGGLYVLGILEKKVKNLSKFR
jgi:hypothetical protein